MQINVTCEQAELLQCESRFFGFFAGRRYGKTDVLAKRIKLRSLARPGWRTMMITPTVSQHEEVFENLKDDPDLDDAGVKVKTKTRPFRIWWPNNSRTEFRSLDKAKNIRSKGVNEVLIDEIQSVKESDYTRIARPLISDRKGNVGVFGQLWVGHWAEKAFYNRGIAPPGSKLNPIYDGRPLYRAWKLPTSRGFKFQDAEGRLELEIVRSQVSAYEWDVEYECNLTSSPNAVFLQKHLAAVTRGERQTEPTPGRPYAIGVDLGRVTDPSAMVVEDVITRTVAHAERMPLGLEHGVQADRVAKMAAYWRATAIIDGTGGATGGHAKPDEYIKLYKTAFAAYRVPYRVVFLQNNVKKDIIDHVSLAVQQKKVSIPADFTDLLSELARYEVEFRNGYYLFHGPNGGHQDDLVIAFSLAEWGIANNWVSTMQTAPVGLSQW